MFKECKMSKIYQHDLFVVEVFNLEFWDVVEGLHFYKIATEYGMDLWNLKTHIIPLICTLWQQQKIWTKNYNLGI